MKSRVIRFTLGCALAFFIAVPAIQSQDKKVVTIWDYNIHDKNYKKKAYAKFNQDNPDIKVNYVSQVGSAYGQVLALAFKVGEEPDLYIPAGELPLFDDLIAQKRILAIDDIAASKEAFLAWKSKFPEMLVKQTEYKGKMWTWPISGVSSNARTLFVNFTLFKEAGIAAMPKTWKEVRDFAAKVTKAGAGKYYGVSMGGKSLWMVGEVIESCTAVMEGAFNGFLDYRTGKFVFGDDPVRRATDLWLSIKNDGSIMPGELSMDDEAAKWAFATNKSAMMDGANWNPGGFIAANPDIDFDVELFPTTDGGPPKNYLESPNPLQSGGIPWGYYISGKTKYPDAVWRLIQFITSEEFQVGWVKAGGGVSAIPAYNKPEYYAHPTMAKFAENYLKWDRIKPPYQPRWDTLVGPYFPRIHPNREEIFQGIWAGVEKFEAFAELEKKLNEGFDEAIAKSQAKGNKVSRSDFIYPDWIPTEHYPPPKKK